MPDISGKFVYRSLLNNPSVAEDFSNLRLGAGLMTLLQDPQGHISGDFDMGGDYIMKLEGALTADGSGFMLRFTAKGIINTPTSGWIYDYLGSITPKWPKGINQLQTITGSVIRTVDHGTAKAGLTASFHMVNKGR